MDGAHRDRGPRQLNSQRFVEVAADAPNAVAQVSAGKVGGQPNERSSSTRPANFAGRIGEIWLHSNNLGTGYWGQKKSPRSFRHQIAVASRWGAPRRRAWSYRRLRHLLPDPPHIAGRIKDLVIIDGRNHLPGSRVRRGSRPRRCGLATRRPSQFRPTSFLQTVFDDSHAGLEIRPGHLRAGW